MHLPSIFRQQQCAVSNKRSALKHGILCACQNAYAFVEVTSIPEASMAGKSWADG